MWLGKCFSALDLRKGARRTSLGNGQAAWLVGNVEVRPSFEKGVLSCLFREGGARAKSSVFLVIRF
jgi:hypothetical protein